MQNEYRDIIFSLDRAIAVENAYNASTGLRDSPILDIKNLKKKFIAWLKQLPCVGFNSGSYDLNALEKKNANLSKNKREPFTNKTWQLFFCDVDART